MFRLWGKTVAAAFFNGEMENELRDLGRLDMFGLMKEDNDREKVPYFLE